MSKIPKRNFVKKNMDMIHKHKAHESGKLYKRKSKHDKVHDIIVTYKDILEETKQ